MQLAALALAAAAAVSAQAANSTSSASSSSSSLIPSNISSACSAFLSSLNSDASLSACVTPLLSATNAAALSSNSTALATSLDKLCSADGCSNTLVRSALTDFYGACATELAADGSGGGSDAVRSLYDVLYTVVPLKQVVCTKDESSGAYCVSALGANTTAGAGNNTLSTPATAAAIGNATTVNAAVVKLSDAADAVSPAQFAGAHLSVPALSLVGGGAQSAKRALTTGSDGSFPNATTYRKTNLPYLFIQPADPAAVLCSSCAQAVFGAYAQWETQTTYALGLAESPILGGQAALWAAARATCGSTWINGIVQAATTASDENAAGKGAAGGQLSGAESLARPAALLLAAAAAVGLLL